MSVHLLYNHGTEKNITRGVLRAKDNVVSKVKMNEGFNNISYKTLINSSSNSKLRYKQRVIMLLICDIFLFCNNISRAIAQFLVK